jgi:hypothetical protein
LSSLIVKRAPIGPNLEDYDVLEGRRRRRPHPPITGGAAGPPIHNGDISRAAHGYEPTREVAMQAFARSWQRET